MNGTKTLNLIKKISSPYLHVGTPKLKLNKKALLLSAVIILIVLAAAAIFKSKNPASLGTPSLTKENTASINLNKEFNFPIYNQGKKTENTLTLTLTTVDRSDKILINGKPASAKDGKDFIIFNLEIKNPTSDKLNVRPIDFFRLVDSQGNTFAADVHNDPVKAEPISIRKTRIGYIIEEDQKSFKFLVGEINGEKQEIEVNI